jgi:tRNA G26 N,N-dimethylase Trm1
MNNHQIKTNNDPTLIGQKIQLRLQSLPNKDNILVLDAFSGEGVLWNEVQKRTDKKINILSIDKNDYKKITLKGDNKKFLLNFDLSKYDIIDLDSYGTPADQLEILYKKKYKGIVHCTFIQSMYGGINKNILLEYGYSESMIEKIPTIFYKNGIEKMKNYIAKKFNVKNLTICSYNKKHYFYFISE